MEDQAQRAQSREGSEREVSEPYSRQCRAVRIACAWPCGRSSRRLVPAQSGDHRTVSGASAASSRSASARPSQHWRRIVSVHVARARHQHLHAAIALAQHGGHVGDDQSTARDVDEALIRPRWTVPLVDASRGRITNTRCGRLRS